MGYINVDIIKRHKIITHYPGDYHNGWNDAIDEILEDEPADVQKVKHGKWIIEQLENEKDVCYCSQCGAGLQNRETRNYIDISGADYCPHCGAKMDEKETEYCSLLKR